MRRWWAALAVVVACMTGGGAATAEKAKQPNVILFLADDLGYGDLACHGNKVVKTPNLDRFAAEAVQFTNFHVSPVCAPTRASLMTGRYNFRTGVADVYAHTCKLDRTEVTIAEVLREAGYATGIFGKWHLGDEPAQAPGVHGFDEVLTHKGWGLPADQYFNPTLLHNGREEKYNGYCMDIFTDAAIDFMKKNRNKPFFIYLPTVLIHVPLVVDETLTREFTDNTLGISDSTQKIYGMVRSVDNNFGRLQAAMKELGLEDNTLLMFTSDNGPCSGSKPFSRDMVGLHGLKGTPYENGIRVPCFVRWPAGIKSPAKVNQMTAHIDLFPTLVELCGAKAPQGVKIDGVSLFPLLNDNQAQLPERSLFFQWDSGPAPRRGHAYSVTSGKWKLVQPIGMDDPEQQHIRDSYARLCEMQGRGVRSIDGKTPRYELYDIVADPGERKDMAAQHPEIVEKLKQQYEAWFDDVCARWKQSVEQ